MKPTTLPVFDLVDHHGKKTSQEDFRGKWLLMFFGFTNCQVVCPRALGKLSQVLEELGPNAEEFVPLYVTVDPDRDTPEVLRDFLASAAPRFTGLTGAPDMIEDLRAAFNVSVKRTEDSSMPDGYTLPHTAFTYVIGPDGSYCTHLVDALEVSTMAQRIRAVLSNSP
ncbi:protein SCO1/2 [Arthrobacter sp. SLBN-100]|uniref:SCO family protein n=1 Tax=Arthrobacter sp. SLBN-100 TaxID=2768450 RepID=UPI00114F0FDC|nr:SCO family protein [Arthrobacter sp. SLBN-100]TQJ62136.1 protein SCO1/2 [Arthrobacter sp. SLBN-100]